LTQVDVSWIPGDATIDLKALPRHDLVTCAYVLDELSPGSLPNLIDDLWSLTGETLIIVEPGTHAGGKRTPVARERPSSAGASVAAPCPHEAVCPVVAPDWCHFSRRVARSRIHRISKGAEVPWEDEKFIYVAASRIPPRDHPARVLAPARAGSGKVQLKL